MAWDTRTQCVWAVTLLIMTGSCSAALKCEDKCDGCSTTSIVCYGGLYPGLPEIVSVLPLYTQAFSFVAADDILVFLGQSNFEHLTELKILNITNRKSAGLSVDSSQQNVFAPLANLQVLKINVPWIFFNPLDDLFKPLVQLEELDLSHTAVVFMDNLRRTLYGLSNSTTLTTINLSSFQNKRYGTRSKIDLAWLLEPLHNCPLRQLHLANNYLKEISPGLIQNTPLMEYVDVSHNQLGELGILSILSSPFFQETLLHKGLQEVDFSYQSPFTEEQSHELLHPNARFPDLDSFTNRRKELSTAAFQERAAPLLPGDIDPEHWSQCTKYLASYSSQTCEIFSPNCRDTLDYLRRNHSQLCELVQVENYPYHSFEYRSLS